MWAKPRSRDGEDDLAKVFAFFEIGVGGDAIVQRPNLVDHRLETPLSDELEDGSQFVLGTHVRAEDGQLASEEVAEVELGVIAGGAPAGDQASADGEGFYTFVPSGRADVFEDDVHAMIVGEAADFFRDVHDAVVNHLIGTNVPGLLEFFVAARGGDDVCAEEFGDLDGGAADAAPGSDNQRGLAGTKLRAAD